MVDRVRLMRHDRYQGSPPVIDSLIDEELHLILQCSPCDREVRLTPLEAAELIGGDCTLQQAQDRLRCAWCGARGRALTVRPCTQDVWAKREVAEAARMMRLWPDVPTYRAVRPGAWDARRPRDGAASLCNAFRLRTPLIEIEADLRQLGLAL